MNVQYRQLFLKDLRKLKKTEVYERIYELAFVTFPDTATAVQYMPHIKAKAVHLGNRLRVSDRKVRCIKILII